MATSPPPRLSSIYESRNLTGSPLVTQRPTPPGLRPTLPAWAIVTPARIQHIQRVAELAARWAEQMGVPDSERNRWLRAVWLHDALRDAPEEELAKWAASTPGPPGLWHGPASAAHAKAEGEIDRGVLDAVRYHSVGLAEWDMVGRILYCADYLDPERSFEREARAALADRLPGDPTGVLRDIARSRIHHLIRSGWPILDPTVRFWNSLVAAGSGSR
ncbi:MAG TPA: HD domain-containing protein [Gemmatimonadales bacterium]|nr:HD domain-containing protein [Gemmatimonadales bacterium]